MTYLQQYLIFQSPILFADDTVIISSNIFYGFSTISNKVFSHMSNTLVLNQDETNIIKFISNESPQYDLKIGYDEKYIKESVN
jgi:hypothetical protein